MKRETWEHINSLSGDQRMAALYVAAAEAALVPAVKRVLGMEIEVRESVVLPGGTRTMRTDGPETDELHVMMDAFTLGFKAATDALSKFGAISEANAAQVQREPGTSTTEAMAAASALEWHKDATDLRAALSDLVRLKSVQASYAGHAAWKVAEALLDTLERRDERRRAARGIYDYEKAVRSADDDSVVKEGGAGE